MPDNPRTASEATSSGQRLATNGGTTWFTAYTIATVLIGLVAVLVTPETRDVTL